MYAPMEYIWDAFDRRHLEGALACQIPARIRGSVPQQSTNQHEWQRDMRITATTVLGIKHIDDAQCGVKIDFSDAENLLGSTNSMV